MDVANIMKFFKDKLRFEVDDPRSNECADLSTESLIKYLEEAQNKLSSASEYYCFICIILYHGNEVSCHFPPSKQYCATYEPQANA